MGSSASRHGACVSALSRVGSVEIIRVKPNFSTSDMIIDKATIVDDRFCDRDDIDSSDHDVEIVNQFQHILIDLTGTPRPSAPSRTSPRVVPVVSDMYDTLRTFLEKNKCPDYIVKAYSDPTDAKFRPKIVSIFLDYIHHTNLTRIVSHDHFLQFFGMKKIVDDNVERVRLMHPRNVDLENNIIIKFFQNIPKESKVTIDYVPFNHYGFCEKLFSDSFCTVKITDLVYFTTKAEQKYNTLVSVLLSRHYDELIALHTNRYHVRRYQRMMDRFVLALNNLWSSIPPSGDDVNLDPMVLSHSTNCVLLDRLHRMYSLLVRIHPKLKKPEITERF